MRFRTARCCGAQATALSQNCHSRAHSPDRACGPMPATHTTKWSFTMRIRFTFLCAALALAACAARPPSAQQDVGALSAQPAAFAQAGATVHGRPEKVMIVT